MCGLNRMGRSGQTLPGPEQARVCVAGTLRRTWLEGAEVQRLEPKAQQVVSYIPKILCFLLSRAPRA